MSPPDDPDIPDEAVLLRRVNPHWYVGDGAETRLSTQAFEDSRDGTSMSVWVRHRLAELDLSDLDVLRGHDGYGLVALTAQSVRQLEFGVIWSPDTDDAPRGLAHAEVHCEKTRSKRKRLRDACFHLAGPLAA